MLLCIYLLLYCFICCFCICVLSLYLVPFCPFGEHVCRLSLLCNPCHLIKIDNNNNNNNLHLVLAIRDRSLSTLLNSLSPLFLHDFGFRTWFLKYLCISDWISHIVYKSPKALATPRFLPKASSSLVDKGSLTV